MAKTTTALKKPPSIHIKLTGQRTTAELRHMLLDALAELETRPFERYKNCNLYITPVLQRNGKHLETIEIKEPYSCAADKYGV